MDAAFGGFFCIVMALDTECVPTRASNQLCLSSLHPGDIGDGMIYNNNNDNNRNVKTITSIIPKTLVILVIKYMNK